MLLRSSQLGIGSETPGGIEASISKDYAHLCAQKVKFTDSLFGDDVTKQIKDITDDNKVKIKTDLGTDPPMQTGALVGVVQAFEGHPFEDEVQPTVLF